MLTAALNNTAVWSFPVSGERILPFPINRTGGRWLTINFALGDLILMSDGVSVSLIYVLIILSILYYVYTKAKFKTAKRDQSKN